LQHEIYFLLQTEKILRRKKFEIFSYAAIGIVFILLVLMLTKTIPVEWYYYVLGFSIILLVIRLVFRIYFAVQDRKNK
jgi:hypothetical protein